MDKLAWSNGEKPRRSQKSDNPNFKKGTNTQVAAQTQVAPQTQVAQEYENKQLYVNFDKGMPGDYCLNNTSYEFSNNKREDSITKSHTRYLVSRACSNPFLTHLNYVDDISNQAEFLIPKNSNME